MAIWPCFSVPWSGGRPAVQLPIRQGPLSQSGPRLRWQVQHTHARSYQDRTLFLHRFTVPVLWDKKTHTIVNNESSEIIRIFNTAFNDLLPAEKASLDMYPEQHCLEIDDINEWVYNTVNSTYV